MDGNAYQEIVSSGKLLLLLDCYNGVIEGSRSPNLSGSLIMEGEAAGTYRHLLKISPMVTEESLANVFDTLWSTRNTGLSSEQKDDIQSVLSLDSSQDLDLVLLCLRSINRKSRNGNLSRDDIQKNLPVELASEIKNILLALFADKCASDGNEQALRDELQVSIYPAENVNAPRLWSREDDGHGYPAPADRQSQSVKDNFTSLKSMTWTIENPNSRPSERVAIICLTLQDQAEPTAGEVAVKIQLSRDTLEAMLRLLSHMNDQLSDSPTSTD